MGRLIDDHPELMAEWNYEKNEGLNPEDFTSGSKQKVWWLGPCGHEWEATIGNRTSHSTGCPYCSNKKVLPGYNDLATVNPDLATQWHPTKNGDLTPEQVTISSGKKVWWICDKGHEWQIGVNHRSNGSGCPYCSGNKVLPGYNDLATINPDLAAEWHPTKNGDLTPEQVTFSSGKKVYWCCEYGHEWQAKINSRANGNGCPICAGRAVLPGYNDLATINPELATEWHPTKNGKLTPAEVTVGSHKKVWWLCEKGHEWQATVLDRSQHHGCPICALETQSSFPEQAIYYYLSCVTSVENRYQIDNKYEIDIYLPNLKVGIEYDGLPWHRGSKAEAKEERKNKYLTQHDIRLIRVKEVDNKQLMPADTPNTIYCKISSDYGYLTDVIHKLTQRLHLPDIDVDINRDRALIRDQYASYIKENSLAVTNPEVANEWHPIKNGNLLPEQVTAGSNQKVWWLGPCGHEWEAIIYDRAHGTSCPFCANRQILPGFNDLATTHPELADEWHPTKNGDLTPQDVMAGSHKKVYWCCEKGHEWQATVLDRSQNHGCPICTGKKVLFGYNDLSTVRPDLAAEWHPTKNGDLMPEQVTPSSGKKVWWLGSCGHEWTATIGSRARGNSCPYCSNKQVLQGYNDLATTNPELAAQWHPILNGSLTPKDVTAGSHNKAYWKCEYGHEWEAIIESRSKGSGCPYCSNKKVLTGYNDLATARPDLAAEWHPTKNGDLTPEQVTPGMHKKVWWICNKGHEWEAKIENRTHGYGCPICSGNQVLAGYNDLATVNPELAAEWHPTLNGDLTPQDVTTGSHKKVWWLGSCGHEWQAVIKDRNQNHGCPICTGKKILPGVNDLATKNPALATQWHPTKNEGLTPQQVTNNSSKKVWWICNRGHEWEARIADRNKGHGCPECRKTQK